MSYERTPDGGIAETSDEHNAQPQFVARLAIVLLVLAVAFGLFVLVAAMTHG